MDEDANDNELQKRLCSTLHHTKATQPEVNVNNGQNDATKLVENTPRSTFRRYWHTGGDRNNQYQKINTPKETNTITNNTNTSKPVLENKSKPKEEQGSKSPTPPPSLSILQLPLSSNFEKTIELLENEESHIVELQSSDEDEVVEVAIPPKPTITIESSDDDEVIISHNSTPKKAPKENATHKVDREVSASPVPSVVSSVSDEFIRGDCIALNISSKHSDTHSFDFSLHGNDLLGQTPPSKKRKKKKSKERTPTPVSDITMQVVQNVGDECFATPQSKAKNKKHKAKSYLVSSVPSADVYDSDSNQSVIDTNMQQNNAVTEKSLPSTDVNEPNLNHSITIRDTAKSVQATEIIIDRSDSSVSLEKPQELSSIKTNNTLNFSRDITTVDLTDDSNRTIEESIIMGNVTGFRESEDYGDYGDQVDHVIKCTNLQIDKFGSTKVPAILYENLDFDNLKGKKVSRERRYSLTTLRAEMEKFYNESWGGENFNHKEIQKNMSRDKSLWVIDPKDRLPTPTKRKVVCSYCNRVGHRDDTCRFKPPVCYMCGTTGHYETRCPRTICVNCGSPNFIFTTMCRNCSTWNSVMCSECGQRGHPSSHCPDVWRRYHNTIENIEMLKENLQSKRSVQQYCSGCTRRGHLVHTCRSFPFSSLPINSPYVFRYKPVYPRTIWENNVNNESMNQSNYNNDQKYMRQTRNKTFPQDSTVSSVTSQRTNKRQSQSPTTHESHVNKKRFLSDTIYGHQSSNSAINNEDQIQRSRSKELTDSDDTKTQNNEIHSHSTSSTSINVDTEKVPEVNQIDSTNLDQRGQIIQDNEVSDTSVVVTSARIYITKEIINKFKTKEGEDWLRATMEKCHVTIDHSDINLFFNITGKVGDQESFQTELRDWMKSKAVIETSNEEKDVDKQQENHEHNLCRNIPKNRNIVLQFIKTALNSLKKNLGDPNTLFKELSYLQNHHQNLLRSKVVSPIKLNNNKNSINEMLKKLNMVLLGQAGLADGFQHVNELHSLHEKLTMCKHETLSVDIRKEIGQHYHCIFAATPRDDYNDLLKKFYVSRKPTEVSKKKKKRKCKSKLLQKNTINSPLPQKAGGSNEEQVANDGKMVKNNILQAKKPLIEKTKNKLLFYRKRLMHSQPTDSFNKKKRLNLVRKLHMHIDSLGKNVNTSSKTLKKMKKIQEQAELFLSVV